MAEGLVFQRVEKKFMLSDEQYEAFVNEIEPYMQMDAYGKHTICNVYYDTDTYDLIRTSIEKPNYKEKLRLRSYGVPTADSKVFLEIKKKVDGIVYKRRETMTYQEAVDYVEKGIRPAKDSQIMRELDYFIKFYKPLPKLILCYDRTAYFGKQDSNLRMTFDVNIRGREGDMDLTKGAEGELLTTEHQHLLEIKVPGAYPLWLSEILNRLEIYPISFSKYGTIYKNKVVAKIAAEETSRTAAYSVTKADDLLRAKAFETVFGRNYKEIIC